MAAVRRCSRTKRQRLFESRRKVRSSFSWSVIFCPVSPALSPESSRFIDQPLHRGRERYELVMVLPTRHCAKEILRSSPAGITRSWDTRCRHSRLAKGERRPPTRTRRTQWSCTNRVALGCDPVEPSPTTRPGSRSVRTPAFSGARNAVPVDRGGSNGVLAELTATGAHQRDVTSEVTTEPLHADAVPTSTASGGRRRTNG